MKFPKLTKREILILKTGLALVLIWAFYNLGCRPMKRKLINLRVEVIELKNRSPSWKMLSEETIERKKAEKEVKERELLIEERRIAEEKELLGVEDELTRLAEDSGVRIISTTGEKRRMEGGLYDESLKELEIQCTYQELFDFLYLLRSLPKLVGIRGVKIWAGREDPTYLEVELILGIYLKEVK